MSRTSLLAAACGLALATIPVSAPLAAATVAIASEGPVIELTVTEQIDVEPDLVTIGAGVSTEAPTAVEALRRNSTEMKRVIDRIKALGVDEKDIQTTGISLNAQYDYDRDTSQNTFRGYTASNRVSVKLRAVEETGAVLDALVMAGATDLSGPVFGIADDSAAKSAARQRAIERAGRQATEYAAMLGYARYDVLEINEAIQGFNPYAAGPGAGAMRSAAVDEAAPVQPGMVSTGVTLTIKYELGNIPPQ
jgi:uncharacterized protein YggE